MNPLPPLSMIRASGNSHEFFARCRCAVHRAWRRPTRHGRGSLEVLWPFPVRFETCCERIVMSLNCAPCQPLPIPQLPWSKLLSLTRAAGVPSIVAVTVSSRNSSCNLCQVLPEKGTLPPLSFVFPASRSQSPESATFNS